GRGGDVQRDVARERLEVLVAGHEVGVAVDLDQHADLAAAVDVGGDGALGGLAAADLERLVAGPDAQEPPGRLDIAPRLGEGVLAVHHARAGAVAQLLDLRGGDRRRAHFCSSVSLLSVVAAAGASAGAGASSAFGVSSA